MPKQLLFWIASLLAIEMSACSMLRRPPHPIPARPDTAKACADWRWIGISRSGAQCPDVPGWTVRPLFPQLAPVQQKPECPGDQSSRESPFPFAQPVPVQQEPKCPGDGPRLASVPKPELIRELNRFCVYELAGGKKSLNKVPFPPSASAELVRFDKDCAALSLSEKYLDAKSWKTHPDPDDLLVQAGRTPLRIENQRGVRLAFLDTQPNGDDVPMVQGRSPHGYTLAKIAQELVCTSEKDEQEPYKSCAAQITTRLALPIYKFNAKHPKHNKIDTVWGGFIGMQSDLAEAIREEVDDWLQQKSQRHLVLNLSLAWDGKLFGGLDGEQLADMQAGTQAIYRALQYAAGYDVLVLAAAGNQKLEPCANFGPLLPAAWEVEVPREKCCGESQEATAPLLYAVGGLRADGSPLDNARPGGMPKRAAFGETKIFTGSSVATAIVSSIAAVVWDTFPDLKSCEVMDLLDGTNRCLKADAIWKNGQVLADATGINRDRPLRADFWFGASTQTKARTEEETQVEAPPVRRLSLCTDLARICEGKSIPLCSSLPAKCGRLNSAQARILQRTDENSVEHPVARGSCQPWLLPQPESVPCPSCGPPGG